MRFLLPLDGDRRFARSLIRNRLIHRVLVYEVTQLPSKRSSSSKLSGSGRQIEGRRLKQVAGTGAGLAIGFHEAVRLGPGDHLTDLPDHQLEHLFNG